jgi:hypothetical protein
VATDLRGYGDSGRPVSADDHSPYAMQQVAQDQLEGMQLPSFDVNVCRRSSSICASAMLSRVLGRVANRSGIEKHG